MKIIKITSIVILVIGLIISGFLWIFFGPISEEKGNELIQERLNHLVSEDEDIHRIQLRIFDGKSGYEKAFVAGKRTDGSNALIVDRYSSASVGKTFTTTLALILDESGRLNIDIPITTYLEASIVEGLFEADGIDHSGEVTLRHLLTHTSGANDFFEGDVLQGESMLDSMTNNPDKYWSPEELIDFTATKQRTLFAPGDGFYYSDTGYVVAGLAIEAATGEDLHVLLHDYIFNPLQMENTSVIMKSTPKSENEELLGIYINGIDYSKYQSLSVDWSGGGIVSTTEDLLIFQQVLNSEKLISSTALNTMKKFENNYGKGITYGMGMMQFDFEELSPFLKGMTPMHGGVGSTGSLMLYDEQEDLYVVFDLGTVGLGPKSVEELVRLLLIYQRIN